MMAAVFYRSLNDAEVIDVEFLKTAGGTRSLRLLVDTGFTGRSSVVLDANAGEFIRAVLPATQTAGALRGTQDRAWVTCRIAELSFHATIMAIMTDLSTLSLPPKVEGMAGLTFLRHFARWGAEQTPDGSRFFLSDGKA